MLDFPGRVACTVFTVGCNFRCPFCHNRELVSRKLWEESGRELVDEGEFWKFLEKRRGVLDGVCITGGEPTLQPDLGEFCRKIKSLGLLVKLDTNGSNPDVVQKLLGDGLVDYVAMDYKVSSNTYQVISNNKEGKLAEKLRKSVELIVGSGVECEFRTTVVPRIHTEEVLREMAGEITGRWIWQNFRAVNCLDRNWEEERSYSLEEIEGLRDRINRNVGLRGWGNLFT